MTNPADGETATLTTSSVSAALLTIFMFCTAVGALDGPIVCGVATLEVLTKIVIPAEAGVGNPARPSDPKTIEAIVAV